MQLADTITDDRTKDNIADTSATVAERSVSNGGLAPGGDQPGVTLERNLSVERPVLKGQVIGVPGSTARFVREVFKRATTAAILALAGLAALLIWDILCQRAVDARRQRPRAGSERCAPGVGANYGNPSCRQPVRSRRVTCST